ncbi:60S ribosomal protein L9 [Striga asiatica]|uniref:60S ribosomal protein L9 n=1 Tax=Striga asiatica TaxID=4170 RepID=A0A5A7QKK1_STRAF|nr:60S ribosomal protein L9 [Striga asiatica]
MGDDRRTFSSARQRCLSEAEVDAAARGMGLAWAVCFYIRPVSLSLAHSTPTGAKTLDEILIGESSRPSLVQAFHSSPLWRLHRESTNHLMWAATPFRPQRPQLAFDATDGGGFLGYMVWTVQDDGTIKVKAPRDKLTLNFKHLNLDFRLITDEATGEKKLNMDMWFSSRPCHCITQGLRCVTSLGRRGCVSFKTMTGLNGFKKSSGYNIVKSSVLLVNS